jgi:hypothetical protein
MRTSRTAALIVLCLGQGCLQARIEGGHTYSPSEVIRYAPSLRGKSIHIYGYLELGPEAHGLWDNKSDVDAPLGAQPENGIQPWEQCVTVYHDRGGAAAIGRTSKAMVEVIGKIGVRPRESDRVDLWSCGQVYVIVTSVVRKQIIAPAP